jgi:hypothetical protein
VFLRLLGIVYALAFWSLSSQILGLIGKDGILPANGFLNLLAQHLGLERYWLFPTLAWINASNPSLQLICYCGIVLALFVVLDFLTGPALLLLWISYLSLVTIGQDFLSFQWDILLLETGFLAIFLAHWRSCEFPWRRTNVSGAPSPIVIWLFRWLLFRLMLESGFVKLASGDPAWASLTALNYHYFTQPLPTPIAWYAAQLPDWFQKLSVLAVFFIELILPFLIFAQRRYRILAAFAFIAFQLLISLTGNYAFFNLLTISLCVLLLDDAIIKNILSSSFRLLPLNLRSSDFIARICTALTIAPSDSPQAAPSSSQEPSPQRSPRNSIFASLSRHIGPAEECNSVRDPQLPSGRSSRKAGRIIPIALAIFIGTLSIVNAVGRGNLPATVQLLLEPVEHFYYVNGYGLFAVMTTSRMEIIVEGSNDGKEWHEYKFKYKPGALNVPPLWVAPHQPRLDWQMWFAALSDCRNNVWFLNFAFRLLQGSPDVLSLLAFNPFPSAPPHYIRAEFYQYKFTDFATRAKTGNYWQREYVGHYLPPITFQR